MQSEFAHRDLLHCANLSSSELLARFGNLVRQDQRCTAALLAVIAEIDERKLWARHAYPSMFAFCQARFHMSESMAGKRIWAARAARRFPVILQMVERGELHLSGIQKLAGHLTEANHTGLLARAKHRTVREIEQLIAEIAPKPDVASRVRALPQSICTDSVQSSIAGQMMGSHSRDRDGGINCNPTDRSGVARQDQSAGCGEDVRWGASSGDVPGSSDLHDWAGVHSPPLEESTARRDGLSRMHQACVPEGKTTPLSPRRYKLEVTLDEETHENLRNLQDLLARQISGADPAAIVRRALELLLRETLHRKAAVTRRPLSSPRPATGEKTAAHRTRAIPAAVRRAVWERDRGRCAYTDDQGRQCTGTRHLEFHHETPFARAGTHEVSNISPRCHAHNQLQADLDFGEVYMREQRRRGRLHQSRTHRDSSHRDSSHRGFHESSNRRVEGALSPPASASAEDVPVGSRSG